jgi:hypothetical protein
VGSDSQYRGKGDRNSTGSAKLNRKAMRPTEGVDAANLRGFARDAEGSIEVGGREVRGGSEDERIFPDEL